MREPDDDMPVFTDGNDFVLPERRIERRDDTRKCAFAREALGLADRGRSSIKASRRRRASRI